jgi:hypothetical protein
MTREPDRPVYILKVRSLRGDGIHELRALLKRLLRPHLWQCVSVERGPADHVKSEPSHNH